MDQFNPSRILAEQVPDFTMNLKLNDGSVIRTSGWFDFEEYGTMEGKAKITPFPRTNWSISVTP